MNWLKVSDVHGSLKKMNEFGEALTFMFPPSLDEDTKVGNTLVYD